MKVGDIPLEMIALAGRRKRFVASAPPGIRGRLDVAINAVAVARKDYDTDREKDKGKDKIDFVIEVDFDPEVDGIEFRWYRGYD